MRALAASALLAGLLASCGGGSSRYTYGNYEAQIFDATTGFEGENQERIGELIQACEGTVERARGENRQVPPGFYVHLAMLYALEGRLDETAAALESEAELYPEGAHFATWMKGHLGMDAEGGR